MIPDTGDAIGERDVALGEANATVTECIVPDTGDAFADLDFTHVGTVTKRPSPDAGDAVGNHNSAQHSVEIERTIPDASDHLAVYSRRNCNHYQPVGTSVFRDGDRIITIYRVSEITGF
ncbi:MAG: hypothetical protein V1872_10810 [bacterium]